MQVLSTTGGIDGNLHLLCSTQVKSSSCFWPLVPGFQEQNLAAGRLRASSNIQPRGNIYLRKPWIWSLHQQHWKSLRMPSEHVGFSMSTHALFLRLLSAVHIICPSSFERLSTDWNWDVETLIKANGFIYQWDYSTFLISFKNHSWGCHMPLWSDSQATNAKHRYHLCKQPGTACCLHSRKGERKIWEGVQEVFMETSKLAKHLHGAEFLLSQLRVNRWEMHKGNIQASTAQWIHSHVVA